MMKRVIKLGGSFLTCPDLESRLQRWQETAPPAHCLAIVGGGGLINSIREIDAVVPLEEQTTHWRCVELLSHTFEIMKQRLDWPTIERVEELEHWIQNPPPLGKITLVRVDTFYRSLGSPVCESSIWNSHGSELLPENWKTTTDSIAALLAWGIHASELVILKSCSIPPEASLAQLAESGIVDQAFPHIAKGLQNVRIEELAVDG